MVIEDFARTTVPDGAEEAHPSPEPYDFGRPAALSREHARELEVSFEAFARQWAPQLSARVGARVPITVESVSMETYGEFADSLPATTTMAVCALPDTDGRIILQLPLSLATAWIIQMVGGRPVELEDDRVLTPIEQTLVRALAAEAVESLTHAMNGLLPSGGSVAAVHFSSQFAQAAAAGDLVIVGRLSTRSGTRTVPMCVMLPAAVVLAGLTSSTASGVLAPPGLVGRQIEESPVELSLRLTPRTVRAQEVLGLSIGDIITIPHAADRPLALVVDGHTVAAAAVGSSGARLACVVTTTFPDSTPVEEIA